jgi:FtsZ-binding cell division protein ZapB
MISLEQVNLLEVKVAKAIEYVRRVNAENAALSSERAALQSKLEANQKRIDELEVLVMRFKEDQGRIEDGIIAALDRLSQFEEAFENSLKDDEKAGGKKTAAKAREKNQEDIFEIPEGQTSAAAKGEETTSAGELDIF